MGLASEDVDVHVRNALSPPTVDKPFPHDGVEFAGGGDWFQSKEAAFEVAHLRCFIREAEGLADVHILVDEGT
jgi:hypothetical protein